MPFQVCNGAQIACSFGSNPSNLVVVPIGKSTLTDQQPAANIKDHIQRINVIPFGMCSSLMNPTVAAATSAAMGVLTPMPCIPVTPNPWCPGAVAPPVQIGRQPALDNVSQLMCNWAGVITFITPGEFTVQVP